MSSETVKKDLGRIKHDFYQTDSKVTVAVMAKGVQHDDVTVEFKEKAVSLSIKLAQSGSEYNLELDLAHAIKPEGCTFKVFGTKVELYMPKATGGYWRRLEGDDPMGALKTSSAALPPASTTTNLETSSAASAAPGSSGVGAESSAAACPQHPPAYPTSSAKGPKNWDSIAEASLATDEEKPEGDAAVTAMFQKIFADASEETQRAMVKSYSESAGTVLSTNWADIGSKETEVKPPDGMEYKKYDS